MMDLLTTPSKPGRTRLSRAKTATLCGADPWFETAKKPLLRKLKAPEDVVVHAGHEEAQPEARPAPVDEVLEAAEALEAEQRLFTTGASTSDSASDITSRTGAGTHSLSKCHGRVHGGVIAQRIFSCRIKNVPLQRSSVER